MNIIKTNTDADKSNNYAPNNQHRVDYSGITILVLGVSLAYLVFWLIALIGASITCHYSTELVCNDVNNVFYGGIGIYVIALAIALFSSIPILRQVVINMAFLSFAGIRMHRDDVRKVAPELIPAIEKHNESLATVGSETYSPTFSDSHNNSSTTNNTQKADGLGGNTSPHTKPDNEVSVLAWLEATKE